MTTTERPTRDALIADLDAALNTAIRLRGTAYYEAAHARINEILDELVGY